MLEISGLGGPSVAGKDPVNIIDERYDWELPGSFRTSRTRWDVELKVPILDIDRRAKGGAQLGKGLVCRLKVPINESARLSDYSILQHLMGLQFIGGKNLKHWTYNCGASCAKKRVERMSPGCSKGLVFRDLYDMSLFPNPRTRLAMYQCLAVIEYVLMGTSY